MSEQLTLANAAHNAVAPECLRMILQATQGKAVDTLILLESIVAGSLMILVKAGGDEKVLDLLTEGVRGRMAELRLKNVIPGGHG